MEALFAHGFTRFYRADFAAVHHACTKAVDEFEDLERTKLWAALISHNSSVGHRCYRALSLWHMGYPDQALNLIREMVELAKRIGQPFGLCVALFHAGWLHREYRLAAEAQAAGNQEIQIAAKHGFAMWHATGRLLSGAGLLLQGDRDGALPLLEQGLGSYRAIGAGLHVPLFLSILGDAYTRASRFPEARQALDEGLAIAGKNDNLSQEAELHRLQGELLLAESPDHAAASLDCFRQAIETARRQQSKAWELRATTSLARLWHRQGRRDDARAALAAIYGTYTEGFATADLVDAAALLQSLEP
jgi:predicted ATPase